jgi:hypothetical protein
VSVLLPSEDCERTRLSNASYENVQVCPPFVIVRGEIEARGCDRSSISRILSVSDCPAIGILAIDRFPTTIRKKKSRQTAKDAKKKSNRSRVGLRPQFFSGEIRP